MSGYLGFRFNVQQEHTSDSITVGGNTHDGMIGLSLPEGENYALLSEKDARNLITALQSAVNVKYPKGAA